MTNCFTFSEIKKLSVNERIRIVQEIWDSIVEDQRALSLTEAQRDELDRRLDRQQEAPEDCRSWDEIKRKFDVS
ncbi:addiction module protein [Desulfococcus multivorans]|jgi:putative addiction module component (TIGR02574 family)|uniref:Addiction module component, TIGR02574 family n=1 Tax=Desulfococcus multivorans DSM 2059 TaxID=1121405 RepID=S7U0M5_DESML|nr:addiction module protein [Desulfococcus multivorans]AOY58380.1 addiction module component, TIGR02574 family [Desulfococcus multivorans]AQV00712.1 hypothetical protein B2D07_07940 [Desulfococcus multivorans]EPR42545.1 addiction module component, TIGR02574 family [Desulfococcus multivorans DSM 2059]SKA18947.1 putative addiction module component, TIGR02574 family [Desulfococcus multivorans DSM 2059]